jgi:hydrogenase maturation protease
MRDTNTNHKIVLGLGNTLNRDEGLGVYALKALEAQFSPTPPVPLSLQGKKKRGVRSDETLEFLDGGVLGLNLLPWVEESSHLLVLDAINAHKEPGTLIELKRDEIPLYNGIKLSDHQVTFQEVLGLANFRGHLPEHLHLIGAQPDDLSTGVGISPCIEAILPQILARAEVVLREWGLVS